MIKLKSFINNNKIDDVKTTILKPRTVYYHECPHCHNEIYEKSTYVEFINEKKMEFVQYHGECKKPIKFYKNQEQIDSENKFIKQLSNGIDK